MRKRRNLQYFLSLVDLESLLLTITEYHHLVLLTSFLLGSREFLIFFQKFSVGGRYNHHLLSLWERCYTNFINTMNGPVDYDMLIMNDKLYIQKQIVLDHLKLFHLSRQNNIGLLVFLHHYSTHMHWYIENKHNKT